jgi:group I intron endonuclease
MEITYIYTLSDPITGEVRYVGKTNSTKRRLYAHIKESSGTKKSHKINWIKSLLVNKSKPKITVIDTVSVSEWQFWETFWIEQFKQWGCKLTNLTLGGEGGKGYRHSNYAKKKMRDSKLGKPLSEEHKSKISQSVLESYISEPRVHEKRIHLVKDDLYQKYIVENLSMPKLASLYGCSEKTIFTNLHEHGIRKDKEVWVKQTSSKPKKPVLQYDLDGNFVREWDSPTTIAEELGYNKGNIASCCRGVAVTANGYVWRYKGENYVERLNHKKRSVSQYDRQGNHVMTFESISAAAILGFKSNNIQDCCVGRSKSHRGFIWRYTEDSPPEKYKKKQQRIVNQFDMSGEFIRSWDSIVSVTKELGIGGNSITTCCKGGYKSAGGFVWKYAV